MSIYEKTHLARNHVHRLGLGADSTTLNPTHSLFQGVGQSAEALNINWTPFAIIVDI